MFSGMYVRAHGVITGCPAFCHNVVKSRRRKEKQKAEGRRQKAEGKAEGRGQKAEGHDADPCLPVKSRGKGQNAEVHAGRPLPSAFSLLLFPACFPRNTSSYYPRTCVRRSPRLTAGR